MIPMTAPEFQEKLDAEIGDASALVVDFSKVNYISSAGLCVLLFYGQEMEDRKGSIKAIGIGIGIIRLILLPNKEKINERRCGIIEAGDENEAQGNK